MSALQFSQSLQSSLRTTGELEKHFLLEDGRLSYGITTWAECFRPTQPTLSRMGSWNKYQPMGGDALQLGSKGRYGLFDPVDNTCHTW